MVIFTIMREKFLRLLSPSSRGRFLQLDDCLDDGLFHIDDYTYQDMLLGDFEAKYNKTKTTYGDELFNHWLRTIKSEQHIKKIQADIKRLQDKEAIKPLEKQLGKIGKQKRGHIVTDIWNGFAIHSWIVDSIGIIFSSNVLLTVLLSIVLPNYLILWISLFLLLNLGIYVMTNRQIAEISGSINYLLLGLIFIKKIDTKKMHLLDIAIPQYKKFKNLFWCTFLFRDGATSSEAENPLSILIDYLRVFLCLEVLSFKITKKHIEKNISDMREVIYFIAYYDCIINSVNMFTNNTLCFSNIGENGHITFNELYHPLLADPVKQTKEIERGLLITGLNMAGKSTYMRTIGINQLLATSFGFAFSQKYSTSIFSIVSSFRINDTLLENKSRYFAEAERLSELISIVEKGKCLCFIDEILSGTNSKDRIVGSIEILRMLSKSTASIVIAATHDTEIAERLKGTYDLGYFDGTYEANTLHFDYLLKEGIVSERNGLLILKAVGINIEALHY